MNLKLVGEGAIQRLLYPEAEKIQAGRPRVRADCEDGERPCPWVGCRYHLFLTVDEKTGAITMNFPGVEVWDLKFSCSLDIGRAGADGMPLEVLGGMMQLTRERTRQIEVAALENMEGELDTEPVEPAELPARTRQHRRVCATVVRASTTMLRLARKANSTSIRAFVASMEHARGLPALAAAITAYLADSPDLDRLAQQALRGLAIAARERNPMVWPLHLLDVTRALDELDAELGKKGVTVSEF